MVDLTLETNNKAGGRPGNYEATAANGRSNQKKNLNESSDFDLDNI